MPVTGSMVKHHIIMFLCASVMLTNSTSEMEEGDEA